MNAESIKEIETHIAHLNGTDGWHRFSVLFPNLAVSDGVKFLCDKAEAWWLMDIIGSYQRKALLDPMLRDIQFWKLKVDLEKSEAVVVCERDTNNIAFRQEIPYTDFPLNALTLYVCPLTETLYGICFPAER